MGFKPPSAGECWLRAGIEPSEVQLTWDEVGSDGNDDDGGEPGFGRAECGLWWGVGATTSGRSQSSGSLCRSGERLGLEQRFRGPAWRHRGLEDVEVRHRVRGQRSLEPSPHSCFLFPAAVWLPRLIPDVTARPLPP